MAPKIIKLLLVLALFGLFASLTLAEETPNTEAQANAEPVKAQEEVAEKQEQGTETAPAEGSDEKKEAAAAPATTEEKTEGKTDKPEKKKRKKKEPKPQEEEEELDEYEQARKARRDRYRRPYDDMDDEYRRPPRRPREPREPREPRMPREPKLDEEAGTEEEKPTDPEDESDDRLRRRRRRRYDDDEEPEDDSRRRRRRPTDDEDLEDPYERMERRRRERDSRGPRGPRRRPDDDFPDWERDREADRASRDKHFEDMRRRMQDREDIGAKFNTNRGEKEKPVTDKYEVIFWGDEHPFMTHWIEQVSKMAPDGVIAHEWMRREASHVGLKVDDFAAKGVDVATEKIYTGHIEYEQRLKGYDIHITNKFVPYLAARPKQNRRVLNEEKKTDL